MLEYLRTNKLVKYFLYGFWGIIFVLLIVWEIAMSKTAEIFNAAMERQSIFKGRIVAESLHCDFLGYIRFKNLNWTTDQGETIVKLPSGYIKINPMDLINAKVGPYAVKKIYIEDASMRLHFNETMKLDVLQYKPKSVEHTQPEEDVRQYPKPHSSSNLNLPENIPNWTFELKNCSITAFIKSRTYVLDKVDCSLAISKHRYADLDFKGTDLGGSLKGEGLALKGRADLVEDKGDFKLTINNVVPESFGLGKLTDPVTVNADITGNIVDPIATGKIAFQKLDLHTMVFSNVTGDFRSEKGLVKVTNTKGNIWNGSVNANGLYNLKSHRYRIDGVGYDIDLAEATKRPEVKGKGQLNFKILCDPNSKRQAVTGTFDIGKGGFKNVGFQRLTGEVFSYNKETYIKHIKLHTKLATITKKAIKVSQGKVYLKPDLLDEETIINELSRI